MRAYEYRHIVGFEDTNLVGNVYYTNHVRWQGKCREMFLREHAPEILTAFAEGFALATVNVSCEYLAELSAFDEIIIRMHLGALKQNRITMFFEYCRQGKEGEQLIARGEQEVACMQTEGAGVRADPVGQPLSQGCFRVGVVGSAQHRHEDLRFADLASDGIDDGYGRASVVDEELFSGAMRLPHHQFQTRLPLLIMKAEL